MLNLNQDCQDHHFSTWNHGRRRGISGKDCSAANKQRICLEQLIKSSSTCNLAVSGGVFPILLLANIIKPM
jgi:hypothetical protein